MHDTEQSYEYDVALSFSGDDRAIVEELAGELRDRGVKVFYDRFVQAKLWGKDLYEYLSEVYSHQCRYCVIFISDSYAKKDWTRLEKRSAQSRSLREPDEFLLPIRIDNTDLDGLLPTVGYLNLMDHTMPELADLVCSKLGRPCETSGNMRGETHLVVELCSDYDYSSRGRAGMIDIQNSVMKLAGHSEARLVGSETSPHRLQIQATPLAVSRLRAGFLNGRLALDTKVSWVKLTALEGKQRWAAPTQVPLATMSGVTVGKKTIQVVCYLPAIVGFYDENDDALSYLGEETTSDMRNLRAFITMQKDVLYIHSNFKKDSCESPTKIATNLPIDLLTSFINLVFMNFPDDAAKKAAKIAHTKYAEYIVKRNQIGRRGDEFYAGAMNISFV